jgi:hypothetical protein
MNKMEHSPVARLHEGMRVWLMDTGLTLQRADHTDASQALGILGGLQALLRAEETLCKAEEQHLFPMLMNSAPYLVCHFESEHGQMAVLRRSVSDAANAFAVSADHERSWTQLQMAFASYMAFVLQHGIREEVVLKGILSTNLGQDAARKIGSAILLSFSQELRGTFIAMMCGATHGDQRRMLKLEFRSMGAGFSDGLYPVQVGGGSMSESMPAKAKMTVAA